jgi:hypothetical protein
MADEQPMPKPKTPDPALPNEAGKLPSDYVLHAGRKNMLRVLWSTMNDRWWKRHNDGDVSS